MISSPLPETWHQAIWRRFKGYPTGMLGLFTVFLFAAVGIYAPLLASSNPIAILYDGTWYFPLFRYLFYGEFYTKNIDLFFNILMFTTPIALLATLLQRKHPFCALCLAIIAAVAQLIFFAFVLAFPLKSPAFNIKNTPHTLEQRSLSWPSILQHLSTYAHLNLIIHDITSEKQDKAIRSEIGARADEWLPTLWQLKQDYQKNSPLLQEQRLWLNEERKKIGFIAMPLLRPFHWEDDAAGSEQLNQRLPWWELTRSNRKDFVAALCFGVRISLVVGFLTAALVLVLAIPIGAIAGYFGGMTDIVVCRFMEIWEAMPAFFMLLFVVAIAQSKSIFLVIAIIGLFSWTGFARYLRGEMLKQRSLPYVEACHALGLNHSRIIFSHLLPNAIPPLISLIPFAIMGAISSEAGLSFLGLGEEQSCSWGILMDEGRNSFPSQSYLLWPAASLLTILLIAIALIGDALRDAIDPQK